MKLSHLGLACAAATLTAALGACGTGAPMAGAQAVGSTPPRTCFQTRSVSGFEAVNDRTVNVHAGVNDVYQFTLFAPCPGIDWETEIAIQSSGGSRICTGLDANLVYRTPGGPQNCQVGSMRKLTP